MKRILAPILLLTFLFPSLAYGVSSDDLVKREGIYYKKFTDVPYTGKVTGKSQGTLKNGKWHGPFKSYRDNGQLGSKGTYKDGKKVGPWVEYWSNGQLRMKGNYKDGERDGSWVRYYEDGQLGWKGTYRDWKREGPWVFYEQNGVLVEVFSGNYKNGVMVK